MDSWQNFLIEHYHSCIRGYLIISPKKNSFKHLNSFILNLLPDNLIFYNFVR